MNWNAPPAVPGYGGMPYQQQQPQQQPWGSQQPGMGGLMMGATMQAPYGQVNLNENLHKPTAFFSSFSAETSIWCPPANDVPRRSASRLRYGAYL